MLTLRDLRVPKSACEQLLKIRRERGRAGQDEPEAAEVVRRHVGVLCKSESNGRDNE